MIESVRFQWGMQERPCKEMTFEWTLEGREGMSLPDVTIQVKSTLGAQGPEVQRDGGRSLPYVIKNHQESQHSWPRVNKEEREVGEVAKGLPGGVQGQDLESYTGGDCTFQLPRTILNYTCCLGRIINSVTAHSQNAPVWMINYC